MGYLLQDHVDKEKENYGFMKKEGKIMERLNEMRLISTSGFWPGFTLGRPDPRFLSRLGLVNFFYLIFSLTWTNQDLKSTILNSDEHINSDEHTAK